MREVPFDVAILVVKGAASNLEYPHCHPWPDFSQLNAVVSCPHENMMPDFNAVLDVLECDDSVADLVFARDGFPGRKDMFQYFHYTLTQATCKAIEDEVRIRLAHCSSYASRNIVA